MSTESGSDQYQVKLYGTSLALGLEGNNEVNENKETVYRFASIVEKKPDFKILKNKEQAYSFVIANEAPSVFAAGEIFIQSIKGQQEKYITAGDTFTIAKINDKSGGYNLLYSNQQSSEKVDNETYSKSIENVFGKVGLPFPKFQPYQGEEKRIDQTNSADSLSSANDSDTSLSYSSDTLFSSQSNTNHNQIDDDKGLRKEFGLK